MSSLTSLLPPRQLRQAAPTLLNSLSAWSKRPPCVKGLGFWLTECCQVSSYISPLPGGSRAPGTTPLKRPFVWPKRPRCIAGLGPGLHNLKHDVRHAQGL